MMVEPAMTKHRTGIDLGGTKIEIAVLDETGRFLLRERCATPQGDYPGTITAIKGLVDGAESRLGPIDRVGLAIPGAVSPATGLVKNANSTWLIGKPFHQDLRDALQRPVQLANDANCFALSEAVDGAGRDFDLVFGIIAGTGLGGGLVFNCRIRIGPHAIAGEWGHNPLPWPRPDEQPGPHCYCGKRGCLESWLCGPALMRLYREATGRQAMPQEIAGAAALGEPDARDAIDIWLDRFARGLAGVINILDPDVIVLGGGLSNLDLLTEDLTARIGPYVFSDQTTTPIRRAHFGDSSGVRGAAWLWDGTPG
jgi:fructokinase